MWKRTTKKVYHMEEATKHTRGGYREGGGRPATGRDLPVTVRISREAFDKLKAVKNKSEFIDKLIKDNL